MVEWPSSGSERTFDQSTVNGRKEPILFYAANKIGDCCRKRRLVIVRTINGFDRSPYSSINVEE